MQKTKPSVLPKPLSRLPCKLEGVFPSKMPKQLHCCPWLPLQYRTYLVHWTRHHQNLSSQIQLMDTSTSILHYHCSLLALLEPTNLLGIVPALPSTILPPDEAYWPEDSAAPCFFDSTHSKLMWLNRSVVAINVMLQLIDIYIYIYIDRYIDETWLINWEGNSCSSYKSTLSHVLTFIDYNLLGSHVRGRSKIHIAAA